MSGRAKRGSSEAKTEPVTFRVTEKEKAHLVKMAQPNMNIYLRETVLAATGFPTGKAGK